MSSKKSKKTRTAVNEEVIDQTAEENNQMETHNMAEENTPATIVEGTEAETQTAEQAAQPEQSAEKPAPKPRVNKRPYIDLVTQHLEAGDMDRKELAKLVLEKFPTVKKGSIDTFLTDTLNPRYSFYKDRVVIKHAGGKMVFADRVETQPEGQPAEVVAEALTQEAQPAE